MQYFPLFFRITGKTILVVGGGKVAVRKVKQLLEFGVEITLVTPEAEEYLVNLARDRIINWNRRRYIRGEAGDYSLVIATTNDKAVNLQIYEDSIAENVPLNIVDQPDLCTVIFPSVIRRGDLIFAIGSGGKAPFFTKAIRRELEKMLPETLEKKVQLARIYREWLLENCYDRDLKTRMFNKFNEYAGLFQDIWSVDDPPFDLWERWLKECSDE